MAKRRNTIAIATDLTRVKLIATRVTTEEHEDYKRYTAAVGITMSMLIEMALKAYFDKLEGSKR